MNMWRYRGQCRPPFAQQPGPGEESVWDYPRPPALCADRHEVVVRADGIEIARSRRALRLCETASPPTFYLPPQDVRCAWLVPESGKASFCEWKGRAVYWSVQLPDGRRWPQAIWSYPDPKPAYRALADWLSFYPASLECYVDDERVRPQPGGFYGGWMTHDIVGPVKGEPGIVDP